MAVDDKPTFSNAGDARHPIVYLLVAMACGILADSLWDAPGVPGWLGAASIAWCCWWWAWRRTSLFAATIFLLIACAGVSAAWCHANWKYFAADEVGRFATEASSPVCLEAIIATPPVRVLVQKASAMQGHSGGDYTRCAVNVTQVRSGQTWLPASGKARLFVAGHLLGIQAGDRVRLFVSISATRAPQNPGEFDFENYERGARCLCTLRGETPDGLVLIERSSWWNPTNWLEQLRAHGRTQLASQLQHREAELASALLLGFREGVDPETTQAFLRTGTIHLLSISGLHVAILASCMLSALRSGLLPRRTTLFAVSVITAIYALLADANPPVVRAVVVVVFSCAGMLWGRRSLTFNSLAAAGCMVLILNPRDLFNVGTQFSFLCVWTLAYLRPWLAPTWEADPLDRLIATTRPWPVRFAKTVGMALVRAFLAGAILWLVCLPLTMWQYHLVTPVALFVNMLAAIPASMALVCGFGVLLCAWLFPPLVPLFGWTCDRSLSTLEAILDRAQNVAGGYFFVAGPSKAWVIGFYLVLAMVTAFPWLRPPRRWALALTFLGLATGFMSTLPGHRWSVARPDAPLYATFISVGHGTSVLLELPGGGTLLYDAGGLSSPKNAEFSIASVLWSRGLNRIDAVMLSHADLDHFNALPGILERFSVRKVFVSPAMFREQQPALAELKQALVRWNVPLGEVSAGDRLTSGGAARLTVLHPPRQGMMGSDNANSIVLAVEHQGRRLLLPGDLEGSGLEAVLSTQPLPSEIVMAPHHGSVRSNPQGFVAWCTPRVVVISGPRGKETEPIQRAYREAGAQTLHTAECGALTLQLQARDIEIMAFRERAAPAP